MHSTLQAIGLDRVVVIKFGVPKQGDLYIEADRIFRCDDDAGIACKHIVVACPDRSDCLSYVFDKLADAMRAMNESECGIKLKEDFAYTIAIIRSLLVSRDNEELTQLLRTILSRLPEPKKKILQPARYVVAKTSICNRIKWYTKDMKTLDMATGMAFDTSDKADEECENLNECEAKKCKCG